VDQVDTNGTVFMGLTMGCCRCHDHKFDPIRMKDYYQLFAIFNSIDGNALDGNAARHAPIVRVTSGGQAEKLAKLEQRSASLRKQIAEAVAQVDYDEEADAGEAEELTRAEYVWIDDDIPAGAKPSAVSGVNGSWKFVTQPEPVFSGTKSHTRTAKGLGQH